MKEYFKRNWKYILIYLFAADLFVFFLFAIKKYPEDYIYYNFGELTKKEKLEAIKDIRSNVIYIAGGILAIIGIYLTWRRTKALDKQNIINEDNNNKNLILQQFSKASELLKDENIAARLSGIYLFEKIMSTNEEYHWPIIELLTAYVREKRDNKKYDCDFSKEEDHLNIEYDEVTKTNFYEIINYEYDGKGGEIPIKKRYLRVPVEKDIQAILTILGRRSRKLEKHEESEENLEEIISELQNAIINKSKREETQVISNKLVIGMNRIELNNVNMYKVNLRNCHFENTVFSNVIFENAYCENTHFENSDFTNAHFKNAICRHAHFEYASYSFANFENTSFQNANFQNTYCYSTNFKNATRITAEQLSNANTLYRAKGITDKMKEEIIKLNPKIFDDPDKK